MNSCISFIGIKQGPIKRIAFNYFIKVDANIFEFRFPLDFSFGLI